MESKERAKMLVLQDFCFHWTHILIIFSNVIALLLWKNCAVDDFYSYTCKNRDQITTNNKSGQCDV